MRHIKNKSLITTIIVAIIVGVLGFFGGIYYQKLQRPNFAAGQFGGQNRFAGRFGNGQGGNAALRPVRGSILNLDSNSVTVKLPDGSSKIIILSGNTMFLKSAAGSKDDLKTGDTIMVFGSQNSDGSITAQNVQINPPMQRQMGSPTGTSQQ